MKWGIILLPEAEQSAWACSFGRCRQPGFYLLITVKPDEKGTFTRGESGVCAKHVEALKKWRRLKPEEEVEPLTTFPRTPKSGDEP